MTRKAKAVWIGFLATVIMGWVELLVLEGGWPLFMDFVFVTGPFILLLEVWSP